MKLLTRRGIAVALVAILVARYVAWPRCVSYVATKALETSKKEGLRITAEEVSSEGLGVRIARLAGWLPNAPVSFEATNITVQPSLLSLLKLSPSAIFSLRSYEGDISGEVTDLSSRPTLSVHLRDVHLQHHPQLMGLGITSGSLTGAVTGLTSDGNVPTSGQFEVTVNDLRAPRIPFVPSLFKGLDSLEHADLRVEGEIINATLNARTVDLRSSFGSMNAHLTCSLVAATPASPPCEAQASFTVADTAPQNLTAWLPLLSQGNLTAEVRAFSLTVRGEHCTKPRPDAVYINRRCWRIVRWIPS
jgi:hypothetical protein